MASTAASMASISSSVRGSSHPGLAVGISPLKAEEAAVDLLRTGLFRFSMPGRILRNGGKMIAFKK